MFQRFFDEGLAQASFLVGCDRTHEAVVIDPRRDAAVYLDAAKQHGAKIVAAIETHVHADFVSGACELAQHGARLITGPDSGVFNVHDEMRDGGRLAIGDVALSFLHTPGHTFEHICILAEAPGEPTRLFSGDLLFVGGVGRPDLVGDAMTRRLATKLFDSLQRVMQLDDGVEVHPGHGAGSLCGAGIGKEPSSTIARERRQNAMLQYTDRDRFVDAVMADIPPTPAYFARMKQVNAAGPRPLAQTVLERGLPSLHPSAAAALAADGATIIDLRAGEAFADGHAYGALNIGFGSKVGYWAGFVVPADAPLLLLADEKFQAKEAALQLLRVGLDRIEGAIVDGMVAWTRAGLPVATLDRMTVDQLRGAMARGVRMQLVDVRSPREWTNDHIEGSINIPVGDIPARAGELRPDVRVATICEGGYRSMLAASLLEQEGVAPLANVTGGMAAYRSMKEVTS